MKLFISIHNLYKKYLPIGLLGLLTLSGCTSSKIDNTSLLELREHVKVLSDQSKHIPLEDFFKNNNISMIQLSPNGKYLAYLKPFQNRMNIHVRSLNNKNSEKRITNQTNRDITAFGWKENDTLIFMKDSKGDENFQIFRASASGKDEKNLTPFKDTKVIVINWLDGVSEDHILIGTNQRNKVLFDAYRLNIKTGEIIQVAENPGNFTGWMADHNGLLRAAASTDGLTSSLYYRDKEQDQFQKIMTTKHGDAFAPLLFTFDNKNLYVISNLDKDKSSLIIFDPKKNKTVSHLYAHPEVDISAVNYSKKRKILTGVTYTTWKSHFHFFDAETEQIYKYLRSQFPKKEIAFVSTNRAEDLVIFLAYSDRHTGIYYLYDIKNKNIQEIANPRPWLKAESLAEQKPIQYTSRDKLKIHGYLTLPRGSSGKNLPAVVIPHGGPWLRDVWSYNSEVQFLASRGYAVFQMNFRGSIGYGKKFWKAGFKQWGKKMQDDITDGVHYLIDQGIIDKNKIAIYGASYGGYAVLAGLTFTPDLYSCGVDYVGISNIFTFIDSIPFYWKPMLEKLYMQIGHPEKDEQLLKEASPIFHVDKIKAPLFIAQGANDPRVKKSESDQIVRALQKRGIKVPYLVKDNEGHAFVNEENRMEFYQLMEAFLDKCL